MSNRNNFFANNVNMTWKMFVRESSDNFQMLLENKEHQLSFQGIEAREAYEKIINESNVNVELKGYNCKRGTLVTRSDATSKSILPTEKKKKNLSFIEEVTINSILKAIEQKDFKFLLKYVTTENVNSTDSYGWTPLMLAAYCGYIEIVEFLLNLGANKEAKEKSGLTAAQLALKRNCLSTVALLKKKTEIGAKKYLVETRTDVQNSNACTDTRKLSKNCTNIFQKSISDANEQLEKIMNFYCDVCKLNFHGTTWEKHETSVLHIFNTKPKLSNAVTYKIPKQNKGYQMLLNTGWDEQFGLGPLGKGKKYPIKVCLKTDRKGFGQTSEKRDAIIMKFDQQNALKYIQHVEEKAGEILTDRQEIIALDKRRNDDRVGLRALQKEKVKKTWITVGPLLLKMSSKTAEELLIKDQKECDIEINKIRSNLKVKINELRDLELNPHVPGLMLQPMSHKEMSAIKQVLGQS
ncbi:G patch domain and ankyrin repeat-containing protein 1 homolog [Calliopsis andreniformis]|uniref:G patch domain and ankyrin repeat-containing protein 1 homolog n=1 Tax=Calliopsis andreniformis TaxID=337506 RepID=UPI003FCDDD69